MRWNSLRQAARCLLVAAVFPAAIGCGRDQAGEGATFTTAHFSGAGNCSPCHDGLTAASGQDVSIVADWSSTMMANSTRDPFWRAKVASELRRAPRLAETINETCTRCHAPMANFESAAVGAPVELFGGGLLDPAHPLHEAAMEGVSCTLCHQIQDTPALGTLASFSGKYTIGTYGSPVDRPLYGQYAGPRTAPMRTNVEFTPTHGPHMERSELCATCHNLKTPFVDAAGEVASTTPESEFPEQMVYSEWLHSSFSAPGGKSCAGCHLPQVDGVRIATRPMGGLPARDGFGRHVLVGGNTMMLDILDRNREGLGVTATGFAATIARTRESLASAATVTIVSASRAGALLEVVVRVDNQSGHKLPTSYPSRRAWLDFVVHDAQGAVAFESGQMNADGSIVGVDADTTPAAFEPHHDVITAADQVQVYESIMGDTDGHVTYTLLRGAAYLKDNRLLPRGFDKATAPHDVAVAGDALDDPSFTDGADTITYRVPVSAGPLSIAVSLRYQSVAFGYVQDLFTDDADPTVGTFRALYNASPVRSETIASATTQVPLPAQRGCVCSRFA
jgi:hypothetical protein